LIGVNVEPFSEVGHRGGFEQAAERKLEAERSADAADEAGSKERVTA
jgi:hypothetical protein